MNTPELVVRRDRQQQLSVESRIPLGAERREICVTTCRGFGKTVVCRAQVRHRDESGTAWTYVLGLGTDGDWSMRLEERAVRGTEGNLVAVHRAGLEKLLPLLPTVKARYGIREAA